VGLRKAGAIGARAATKRTPGPLETYRGKRNFELGALLHSADASPVARKNLIEVSTSIQHADNFGDVIFHTIEDDV
jgi:hypothetical protein